MTTGQAAHIVVVLQRVDADGARIARRPKAFWRQSGVDMFVFVLVVV